MEVSCLGVVLMNSDAVTHLAALCSIHSCGSARRGQTVSMSAVRHSKLESSTSVADFIAARVSGADTGCATTIASISERSIRIGL